MRSSTKRRTAGYDPAIYNAAPVIQLFVKEMQARQGGSKWVPGKEGDTTTMSMGGYCGHGRGKRAAKLAAALSFFESVAPHVDLTRFIKPNKVAALTQVVEEPKEPDEDVLATSNDIAASEVARYNATPVIRKFVQYMQKTKQGAKWQQGNEDEQFTMSMGGFSGRGRSKRIASLKAALSFFGTVATNVDLTKFLKSNNSNSATPLLLLNNIATKMGAKLYKEVGKQTLTCSLKQGDKTLYSIQSPTSHQRVTWHEHAVKILDSLARDFADTEVGDEAWKALRAVRPNSFVLGQQYPEFETETLEFKGSNNESEPMTKKAVKNRMGEYAKEVCAFLNSGKCCRLLIGIHDKSRRIQGVEIRDPDAFCEATTSSFFSKIKPRPYRIRCQVVPVSCKPKRPTPTRPDKLDAYTRHLEAELQKARPHSTLSASQQNHVYMLEVYVHERAPNRHEEYNVGGTVFVRVGSQTHRKGSK